MRIGVTTAALVVLTACSSNNEEPGTASRGKECAAIVHVFVQTGVTAQRERRIADLIDEAEGVIDWSFHSHREAYREFKRLYAEQPDIYKSQEPSDFPARFEVMLASDDDYGSFERALAGATTGVDRVVPGGCASPEPSR